MPEPSVSDFTFQPVIAVGVIVFAVIKSQLVMSCPFMFRSVLPTLLPAVITDDRVGVADILAILVWRCDKAESLNLNVTVWLLVVSLGWMNHSSNVIFGF